VKSPWVILGLIAGGVYLLGQWLRARSPGGAAGPGLQVTGPSIRNEDSSGLAAAGLFGFLAGGSGGGPAPDVQLSTSGLSVNVRNREGPWESFVRSWCAADAKDGICRSSRAQALLTKP
jgi:hypothetical protein